MEFKYWFCPVQTMIFTPERPFQSLALTGGGYRGLFTARVLEVIESRLGEPVGRRFDLSCGTSIGGIVALAVAFEVPMSRVVQVFLEEGQNIFPDHTPPSGKLSKLVDLYKYRARPRYSTQPLRKAIEKLIDKDALLGDAKHPVAIPAVNVSLGKPQVFKTRHRPEWDRDWRFRAVDVAIATAAAPTFFELAEVDGNLYADGGLFANAPDLVAIHEGEHFFNAPVEAQRMLSIGTTTKSYSISFGAGKEFGISDWMEDARLFAVTISSQQQFIEQLARHRMGERYVRLDHEPSQEQAKDLGLDVANETAKKTLVALANKIATDALSTRVLQLLQHDPQLRVLRKEK